MADLNNIKNIKQEKYIVDDKLFKNLLHMVDNNSLKFYRFYNIDFNPVSYGYHEYKLQGYNESDPSMKILNKTYYDIEIFIDPPYFPDADKAERPVNAIATYNSIQNKATLYYLSEVHAPLSENPKAGNIHKVNIQDQEKVKTQVIKKYKELCDKRPEYLIENINIEVLSYTSEEELLSDFFKHRQEEQSLFLIGFNSSIFDDPYIINRMINLFGKDAAFNIISEFGQVQKKGRGYSWPDIIPVDLLQLYKPVDAGGSGMGKSLPNYKLNTISEEELNLIKLELPGGFNDNFLNDIVNYLTYNLLDTLLVFLLDRKLRFLENQYALNNYNQSLMSQTMNGRSLIYNIRNNLLNTLDGKLMRFKKLNKEIYYSV